MRVNCGTLSMPPQMKVHAFRPNRWSRWGYFGVFRGRAMHFLVHLQPQKAVRVSSTQYLLIDHLDLVSSLEDEELMRSIT